MSFYKEELAGERHNYVHEWARVSGKCPADVLADIIDETIATNENVRAILQGREREAWESFVAGYVAWHRYTPRYKLGDLYGDKAGRNLAF